MSYRFVASPGQTLFSGSDTNGTGLAYVVGNTLVIKDSAELAPGAFIATTGTSITLTAPCVGGEQIIVITYGLLSATLVPPKATSSDVTGGTDDLKYMTVARTAQAFGDLVGTQLPDLLDDALSLRIGSSVSLLNYAPLGLSDYTSAISEALADLNATGGGQLIIPKGLWPLLGAVSHTLSAPLRITFMDGARIIRNGTYTTDYLLNIQQAGNDCVLEGVGRNDINLNNNSPVGIYLRNNDVAEALQVVRGLRVRNARGSSGDGIFASGIALFGTSRLSLVENNLVQSVTRPAGISGGVCQGIVVTETGIPGVNPKIIISRNNRVEDVTSDDVSPAGWDFDGIVLFQQYIFGTACTSDGDTFFNCRGRALKIYAANPVVTNVGIYRNIAGGAQQTSEIALQGGSGIVRNVSVRYAGGATHNSGEGGTNVVSFYTEAPRPARLGVRVVDGLSIDDASTGGNTISALVDFSIGNTIALANPYTLTGTIANVQVLGKNIRAIARVNNNGRSSPTVVTSRLKIENILAALDFALAECDSALPNIECTLINVTNTETTRMVLRRTDLGSLGGVYGKWRGSGVTGIQRSSGDAVPAIPGFAPMDAIFEPNSSIWHGRTVLFAQSIAAGATLSFDIQAPCLFNLMANSGYGAARIYQRLDNAVIKDLGNVGWTVGTASEPGTGDLRIWSTSTNFMNFKNATGGPLFVTCHMDR